MMSQEQTERISSLIDSVRALKEELTDLENLLCRFNVPASVALETSGDRERE